MTLYYHYYYKDVKPGLWNIWSTNDLNKLKGYLSGDNKTTFIRDDITCTIDPRYITVHYSAIEHSFDNKTSVTLLNSREAHMPRPNGRDKGVLRELLGEKWPLYIGSALDNLTCYIGICPWTRSFLRRAMNCGTHITGQLRQPTTPLHTWPITWDIKGCLCLFKHHSPKHTPDWLNSIYCTTIVTKKQSNNWIHKKNAI